MADDASQPTNFAQYEQAQRFNATQQKSAPAATAAAEESSDETTKSEAQAETAAEPETADDKPIQSSEKAGAAAADKKPKAKPSLSDEHARLLREVTDLRRQRRELQQSPAPTASSTVGTASPPAPTQAGTVTAIDDEKPPARPKLSTFQGTLDEYEKAVEKYDEDSRQYQERQQQRKQAQQQAQEQQQKVAQSYGERLSEHLKTHPDYDEEIAQTPLSALMVDIVLHQGPELGQALIDDKGEARRIQALPRDVQIFEMGKLAARLNGSSSAAAPADSEEEESKTNTSPPAKIPAKLGASGGSASKLNEPGHGAKTYAEFEAIEKRLKTRR